jgi:diacylglycerol kinase family enzyme
VTGRATGSRAEPTHAGAGGAVPVFLNEGAGRSRTTADTLREHFGDRVEVRVVEPAALADEILRAVEAGAPIVGVAGGDGSMRTAASVLAGTATALLCIPTGTLNTFARRVAIPDMTAAVAALGLQQIAPVSLGAFDDAYFLNTLTIGEYARIVRRRERYRRFIGKWPAALAATVQALATLRRITLRLDADGHPLVRHTPVVWIGLGRGSFPRPPSPDRRGRSHLEVVVVRSTTKRAAAACLFRLARGVLRERAPLRDPELEILHTDELLIARMDGPVPIADATPAADSGAVRGALLEVTADGEVLRVRDPIRVGIREGALRVLRGPASPGDAQP